MRTKDKDELLMNLAKRVNKLEDKVFKDDTQEDKQTTGDEVKKTTRTTRKTATKKEE
ncbi:hypothetical protein [Liquorilactobacillus cacaonum]|uniref:Uncharacterized protein n=1 Tax=Liquorilactobacillus cacaonum DSM 21116 TaxID=1423729 RepID=A0A0R2CTV7_9LACO|nr:hypothetical protein [Liquorilactobacillus cacaonum]KRM91484.1 hypothetical protein FC80_GL000451 [Liquorilactobacillus cacaonum DSM 21116]